MSTEFYLYSFTAFELDERSETQLILSRELNKVSRGSHRIFYYFSKMHLSSSGEKLFRTAVQSNATDWKNLSEAGVVVVFSGTNTNKPFFRCTLIHFPATFVVNTSLSLTASTARVFHLTLGPPRRCYRPNRCACISLHYHLGLSLLSPPLCSFIRL